MADDRAASGDCPPDIDFVELVEGLRLICNVENIRIPGMLVLQRHRDQIVLIIERGV